ncbi:MAG TPA: hypothetical protein VGJ20_35090 [Xanthobacteraceae bacterium]|jgi:hypothetical protein
MGCGRSLFRIGCALAVASVLAGCTKGGQFDPTEVFSADMFDTKKKIQGQREPVFPDGVPGTTTGIPQDLVKGYQAPPDQAVDNGDGAGGTSATAAAGGNSASTAAGGSSAATAAASPESAAKPKPKPKPKPKLARAPAQNDSAWDQKPPARITVGHAPPSAQQQATPAQQPDWPQSPAPAQQTAQPAQSIWPNPPAASTQ